MRSYSSVCIEEAGQHEILSFQFEDKEEQAELLGAVRDVREVTNSEVDKLLLFISKPFQSVSQETELGPGYWGGAETGEPSGSFTSPSLP